jgi:hypothetical protein
VTRYAVRISRFEDQMAFRRVLELLGRLYPDRAASEFEALLAKLPCLVSHDAEESVAEALRDALEARGARVRLLPIDEVGQLDETDQPGVGRRTVALSPEVDLEFLRRDQGPSKTPGARAYPPASARAVPTAESVELSGEWTRDKAPWEE